MIEQIIMKYMCKQHPNNPQSHRESIMWIDIQSYITLISSIELTCQACCEGYLSRVIKFMSKLCDFLWLSLSWLRISWPPSWDQSQKGQERPGETQANFCWWVQGKIIINTSYSSPSLPWPPSPKPPLKKGMFWGKRMQLLPLNL